MTARRAGSTAKRRATAAAKQQPQKPPPPWDRSREASILRGGVRDGWGYFTSELEQLQRSARTFDHEFDYERTSRFEPHPLYDCTVRVWQLSGAAEIANARRLADEGVELSKSAARAQHLRAVELIRVAATHIERFSINDLRDEFEAAGVEERRRGGAFQGRDRTRVHRARGAHRFHRPVGARQARDRLPVPDLRPEKGNRVMHTRTAILRIDPVTPGDRAQVRADLRLMRKLPTWAGWWHEYTRWARLLAYKAMHGETLTGTVVYGYQLTRRLAMLEIRSAAITDMLNAATGGGQ